MEAQLLHNVSTAHFILLILAPFISIALRFDWFFFFNRLTKRYSFQSLLALSAKKNRSRNIMAWTGVFFLLLGMLAMSHMVVAATRTPAFKFQESKLPSVSIPLTSKASVAPIESEVTAAVRSTMIFPATSATFCKAAGIMCNEDIEIQPYATKANGTSDHNHASQVITTINDFQLDFFLEENLVKGNYMQLVNNLFDPIPIRPFLPSKLVKVLPVLTTANLPTLLATFNIGKNTRMAAIMATATYLCESPALPGEQRACPTSMEEMVAFVAAELGDKVRVLSTSGAPTSAPTRKGPVKILSLKKRSLEEGKDIVVCHNLMFPSQLYYCHHVTRTKVVQASLIAMDGSVIHGVAICHIDTTLWASEHPAFAALDIPRGAEACHWNTQHDLIWIKQMNDVQNVTQLLNSAVARISRIFGQQHSHADLLA